jgi:hypothetical protein
LAAGPARTIAAIKIYPATCITAGRITTVKSNLTATPTRTPRKGINAAPDPAAAVPGGKGPISTTPATIPGANSRGYIPAVTTRSGHSILARKQLRLIEVDVDPALEAGDEVAYAGISRPKI